MEKEKRVRMLFKNYHHTSITAEITFKTIMLKSLSSQEKSSDCCWIYNKEVKYVLVFTVYSIFGQLRGRLEN